MATPPSSTARLSRPLHRVAQSSLEGDITAQVEVGGALKCQPPTRKGPRVDANLDLLLSDCLLHRRRFPAQALDQRAASDKRRGDRDAVRRPGDHGNPVRSAVHSGRRQAAAAPVPGASLPAMRSTSAGCRLSGQIEALSAEFARRSPGFMDDLLLVDSTPVECARSRQTVKRGGSSSLAGALSDAADYGYCASRAIPSGG